MIKCKLLLLTLFSVCSLALFGQDTTLASRPQIYGQMRIGVADSVPYLLQYRQPPIKLNLGIRSINNLQQVLSGLSKARLKADSLLTTKAPRRALSMVNVKSEGAAGDSLTDDTAPLKAILLAHGGQTLYFEGIFRISTQQLAILSGTRLVFAPGSRLVTTSTSGDMLLAQNAQNIAFDNATFRAPSGNVKALHLISCQYIYGVNISAVGCGILRADHSAVINLRSPTGYNYGAGTTAGPACIDLFFSSTVDIDQPQVTGYGFGIQYWGGDANPVINAETGQRKAQPRASVKGCRDIHVHGGYLGHAFAGFWGSMGEDISIEGTRIEEMEDVGADPEGTRHFLAENLTITNCANGGFSSFFNNDDIVFRSVKSYATRPGQKTFAVYNNPYDNGADAGSLTLDNVTLSASQLQTDGYVNGAVTDLVVRDCVFENVSAQFETVLGRRQTFQRNRFRYSIGNAGIALKAGNVVGTAGDRAALVLEDNTFTNQPALSDGSTSGFGMQLFHSGTLVDERIERNRTAGFQLDLVLQPQPNTLPQNQIIVDVRGNTFGNGQVFINPPTGGNLPLIIRANNASNRNGSGGFLGGIGTYIDARTPVTIDLAGLAPGHLVRVAGDGRLVPDAGADLQRKADFNGKTPASEWNALTSYMAATTWFYVGSLPNANAADNDAVLRLTVMASIGYANAYQQQFMLTSRGGLQAKEILWGLSATNQRVSHLVAYQQANGTLNVYLRGTSGFNLLDAQLPYARTITYASPSWSATTTEPAGAKVFDGATVEPATWLK